MILFRSQSNQGGLIRGFLVARTKFIIIYTGEDDTTKDNEKNVLEESKPVSSKAQIESIVMIL